MSEPADTTQVLGEAGETCRECGAPLAADQRYCLNCGRRRGEPRVDFQHLSRCGRGERQRQRPAGPSGAEAAPPEPTGEKPAARLHAAGGGRRHRGARR